MNQSSAILTSPTEALEALLKKLTPVEAETLGWLDASGRVLAKPMRSDRDSPAHDVSAMDGYAVRLGDLTRGEWPVAGEVVTGDRPPAMPQGAALRIFTGGCVPPEAETVIRREDVDETAERIRLCIDSASLRLGQHIRRRGENMTAGEVVVEAGQVVHPATMGAIASFGHIQPTVHRRVRLAVLVTGDELLCPEQTPEPWQVRDSNGPTLQAMFASLSWVDWQGVVHVQDTLNELAAALQERLAECDAVLLTGGVSMGDYDHVPAAVRQVGGEVVFHKLPIRPGKPLLGAVGPSGQAILGLPGNPVSVMVTARRFASAVLRKRAGFVQPIALPSTVQLANAGAGTLALWWHRPVRLVDVGVAELMPTMGSGDVVSVARSDGFVELPPRMNGEGPWAYWPWSMT